MNYPLENLNDERFQQLCQALLAKANPGVQCFPVGQPDGGRDATRRNFSYSRKENFLVYQVKFVRDPSTKKNPREWLLKIIGDEIEKVRALVDRSATGYFLITNVRGSSHLDNGSIDQMQDLLSDKLELPAICWWRDDLERRLDDAWDIKWAYPEVMTGPDFLRAICEVGLTSDIARRESALRAFIRDQYIRDSQVKFRQVDLQNGLLDLFVDVPMARGQRLAKGESAYASVIAELQLETAHSDQSDLFDEDLTPEPYTSDEVGAASFLLSRLSSVDFSWVVLEGGPGQGKSTISQYVAQVHRIRLLDEPQALKRLAARHQVAPVRLPIRIDLRDFAEWMRQKNPFSRSLPLTPSHEWPSQLEPFIAALISHHAGGVAFSVDDLIAIARISAMCLVLDGLDDIADVPTRSLAVEEIAAGCQRLLENAASLQVIVTSRPAIFSDSPRLPDAKFQYTRLASLTPRLIGNYVELWGRARNVSPDIQAEFREFIRTKLGQPHIKELARNPMQLAILLSLVNTRGVALPEKRTALYDAYIEHFLAREAEKSATVRKHRDLILDLHKYLAWVMHSDAEEKGGRGSLLQQQLVALVREYLEAQGHDPSIAAHLFKDMVDRVFVLVSRDQGSFEFEVQPLREYFAARFLFETAPLSTIGNERTGSVPDRFEAIAPRSYWMNVARFFAGCYSKGEIPSLVGSLQELYDDRDLGLTTLPALLSIALLSDWVFSQLPKQVSIVVGQLTEVDRLLRLSSEAYFMRHNFDETPINLPERAAAFQLALKCFELLDGQLPQALESGLAYIVQANMSHAKGIADEWFRRCMESSGDTFTRWLRYGRMIGTLNTLGMEQIAKLPISAKPEHVAELYEARKEEFLESDPKLFDQALQLLLRFELMSAPQSGDRISPLNVLALGLSATWYRYAIRQPVPLSMGEAVQRFTNQSIPQLLSWNPIDTTNPQLRSIKDFANVLATQLARPVKDWSSSLSPWTELTDMAMQEWGDTRAVKVFATFAAAARTGGKASSRNSNLFSGSEPICERTRYARLSSRNADYWATQLRNAATTEEKMFAAIVCVSWCPLEVILSVADEFGRVLQSLPAEDWHWLATRTRLVRWSCGFTGQEKALKENSLPVEATPRTACTLAEMSSGALRREIVSRYLDSQSDPMAQSDPMVDKYRMWLAIDFLRFGKKEWAPDLNRIAELFKGEVFLPDGHELAFSRGNRADRMSIQIARSILGSPGKFPPELVYCAEKSVSRHVRSRRRSLAETVRRAGWFSNA